MAIRRPNTIVGLFVMSVRTVVFQRLLEFSVFLTEFFILFALQNCV